MYSLGCFCLPPGPKSFPLAAGADRADVQHGFGSGQGPTHAALLHAVFDDVPASSFDHAAGNRIASVEVRVVTHTLSVFLEVIACCRDIFKSLSGQVALARHPPHTGDD